MQFLKLSLILFSICFNSSGFAQKVNCNYDRISELIVTGNPNYFYNNLALLDALKSNNNNKLKKVYYQILENDIVSDSLLKIGNDFINIHYKTNLYQNSIQELIRKDNQKHFNENSIDSSKTVNFVILFEKDSRNKINDSTIFRTDSISLLQEDYIKLLYKFYNFEIENYAENIIPLKSNALLNTWIQDPFIVKKVHYKNNQIAISKEYHNSYKQIISSLRKDYYIDTLPFNLDGGNTIFLDSFVFIGKDVIDKITEDKLSEYFGKDLILVGSRKKMINYADQYKNKGYTYQVDYHLDLYLNVVRINDTYTFIFNKIIEDELTYYDSLHNALVDSSIFELKSIFKTKYPKISIDFCYIATFLDGFKKFSVQRVHSYLNNLVEINPSKDYNGFVYLPSYGEAIDSLVYKNLYDVYTRKLKLKINYIKGEKFFKDLKPPVNSGALSNYRAALTDSKGSLHCTLKVLRRQ